MLPASDSLKSPSSKKQKKKIQKNPTQTHLVQTRGLHLAPRAQVHKHPYHIPKVVLQWLQQHLHFLFNCSEQIHRGWRKEWGIHEVWACPGRSSEATTDLMQGAGEEIGRSRHSRCTKKVKKAVHSWLEHWKKTEVGKSHLHANFYLNLLRKRRLVQFL